MTFMDFHGLACLKSLCVCLLFAFRRKGCCRYLKIELFGARTALCTKCLGIFLNYAAISLSHVKLCILYEFLFIQGWVYFLGTTRHGQGSDCQIGRGSHSKTCTPKTNPRLNWATVDLKSGEDRILRSRDRSWREKETARHCLQRPQIMGD